MDFPFSFQAIDKVGQPILFSLLGNSLFMLSFLFIGPLPMLKFEPYVSLIQVSFVMLLSLKVTLQNRSYEF